MSNVLASAIDGFPVVRLGAEPRFSDAVATIATALREAAAAREPYLLVCIRDVRFASPSIAARHAMVRQWAAAAGAVTVALVARPEFIDPKRFGVVAAANFGLHGQVFEAESDALEWLRQLRDRGR